jgi:hypothetical protein
VTIHEIEQAITELSPNELARFREWFEEFDAKVWDPTEGQFERDAESGKLTALQPTTEEHLKKLRGSLKGKGVLKALMEERRKGQ